MGKSLKSVFSFLNFFGKTKKRSMHKTSKQRQSRRHSGKKHTRGMRGGWGGMGPQIHDQNISKN